MAAGSQSPPQDGLLVHASEVSRCHMTSIKSRRMQITLQEPGLPSFADCVSAGQKCADFHIWSGTDFQIHEKVLVKPCGVL